MDRFGHQVLIGEELVSPTLFSLLMESLKVKDDHFLLTVKVLTKGAKLMDKNHPLLVENYFLSEEFCQHYTKINTIIDEIWKMRTKQSESRELRVKHRKIYALKSAILHFMEMTFGRSFLTDFRDRLELRKDNA